MVGGQTSFRALVSPIPQHPSPPPFSFLFSCPGMTSRGGGAPSGTWSRGGLPSRPGSAHALNPPSASNSSFPSSSSQPSQPFTSSAPAFSGFSNRGSSRGGSFSNGSRGGRGGGNALSRMGALVDDEGDAEAGEDPAGADSEGLAIGGEEDDEGKAHARSQRFNKKFEGNMFEKVSLEEGGKNESSWADLSPPSFVPSSFTSSERRSVNKPSPTERSTIQTIPTLPNGSDPSRERVRRCARGTRGRRGSTSSTSTSSSS